MPTCSICNSRSFSSNGGLKQHMRTSNVTHPYCDICDKLFGSLQGYDMHMASVHPRVRGCGICNVRFRTQSALSAHYLGSTSHPTCVACYIGLKNEAELQQHNWTCHPQVRCELCDIQIEGRDDALLSHYLLSPLHPACHSHNLGFKDYAEYARHCESVHKIGTSPSSPKAFSAPPVLQLIPSSPPYSPPLRPSSTPTAVEIPEPPVIETSPSSEPEPSLAAPTEPVNRRSSTTPLIPLPLLIVSSAEMNSPRSDKDPYPTALATPSTLAPESDVDTYSVASTCGETEGCQFDSSSSSPTQILKADAESPTIKSVGGSDVEAQGHETSTPTSPPMPAAQDGLEDSGVVSPLVEAMAQSEGNNLQILNAPMFSAAQRSLSGPNLAVENNFAMPESNAPQPPRQESPVLSECFLTRESSPSPRPAHIDEEIESKVLYTPNEGQFWPTSPLYTRYANYSSTLTFMKPTIRISTASSRNSDSRSPTPPSSSSSISDSSEPFARSPSVTAPAGLATLPSTSPFELTPIDPPVYELRSRHHSLQITIPEHLNTLLHLASSLSPSMPSSDELLTPSSLSHFDDSPQDIEIEWKTYGDSIMAEQLPLPASVASSPCGSGGSTSSSPFCNGERGIESNVEDVREDATTEPLPLRRRDASPHTLVQDSAPQNMEPRLHCRICNRNPCVDMTATMCGHIFCYGCITDCVMKTSRCPTCLTPTLLNRYPDEHVDFDSRTISLGIRGILPNHLH
ncbi:hypothetical protein BDN71DRAFT_1591294 [Pleurotus eryngii]|uniref:RING-type domain-containing protein n=1 Tax=Pleurotus eryngii TaxID=5323 RepID=A0A9P5ZT50_PLEER|nr:hypothetical protein BDN71DRAFT_1591294 [Pleurotus eryngii]